MSTQQISSERLNAYVEAKVLPALGLRGGSCILEPVKSGRNLVWLLRAGGRRYVLKAVSKRFRIKNIIWAHGYIERRGIPVPKLLFADRAWKTAESTGYYFACEEFVEGAALDALGAGRARHIPEAAALFARMHATGSLRWGKLKTFQLFGFREYLSRKNSERARALEETGCSAGSAAAWLERNTSDVPLLGGFSLCHGDVNMKNILLCPGGGLRLIDTEAFKFLPCAIEYHRLAYGLCGFDDALHEEFRRSYLAAATRKNRRAIERLGRYYHACVLLEIAWHFNKKLKREGLPGPERDGFISSRDAALARLADITNNTP